MSEKSHSTETLSDEALAAFARQAQAMHEAETVLDAGVADLLARPFDESSQQALREVLDSNQLKEATRFARQLKEGGES